MIVLSIGMGFSSIFGLFNPELTPIIAKVTLAFLFLGSLQTALGRSFGIYFELRAAEKK